MLTQGFDWIHFSRNSELHLGIDSAPKSLNFLSQCFHTLTLGKGIIESTILELSIPVQWIVMIIPAILHHVCLPLIPLELVCWISKVLAYEDLIIAFEWCDECILGSEQSSLRHSRHAPIKKESDSPSTIVAVRISNFYWTSYTIIICRPNLHTDNSENIFFWVGK